MILKKLSVFLSAILVLSLSACTMARKPIGTTETPLDPAKWEGKWVLNDDTGPFIVRVRDATQGVLAISTTAKPNVAIPLYVRNVGSLEIASIRISDFDLLSEGVRDRGSANFDEYPNQYFFFRLQRVGENTILFEIPNFAAFLEVIESGKVNGTNMTGNDGKPNGISFIDDLNESQIKLLKQTDSEGAFISESISLVARRQ